MQQGMLMTNDPPASDRRHQMDSEHNFRLLIQGVSDYAICMLDPAGRVSNWNTGAQRIKGYTAEEIVGEHFSIFYPPEDRAIRLPDRSLETARAHGRFEAEGWRMRKDGSRFFASVVLEAIREGGKLVGFTKITRDITERIRARSALTESENQFRLLVNNVVDYALYMLDPDGNITSWNLGGQRIKGYLPEEIVGKHFSLFYTAVDREAGKPERALRIALENGKYEEEGLRVRKDGTFFWASVVIDPVRNDTGELIGFAKITRDISEKREAQQRLDRMQRQLSEAQKMDALGQLTGGVAHDFNNLLMAISGNARLIKRHATEARATKAAEAIEAAVQRGAALTRQLLTFARRQQVNPDLVDVGRAVEGVHDVLRAALGSAVSLIVDISPEVWPVFADPAELETALVNLIINARDAMPDGGTVTISACNSPADGELAAGESVCIAVRDQGAGIPEDVLSRIFDPFFTTKPAGKGTGLGLSQVQGFAHQAGGLAKVKSRLGEGTEVTICLPRGETKAAAIQSDKNREGATVGTVLLVEDNPDVAAASSLLLEELGYRVKWAPNAQKAIIEVLNDGIDILFSDIVMPGMDGLTLARQVKQSHPAIPIVLATGFSDAVVQTGAEFPVLRKPYELHELGRALAKARFG